jgi:Mrp family chromosome partitioning ATPase
MQIPQITAGFHQEGVTAAVPALALEPRPKLTTVVFKPELATSEALQAAVKIKLLLGSMKRMFAVSGIGEKDGSSLLTAALGTALATLDANPVLVIDANTRGSRLSRMFDMPDAPGLVNLLEDHWDPKYVTQPAQPGNLFFLPLGKSGRSLASLIGDPRCARIMESIRSYFRYIAVDCGILRESPDNMLFASLSDGVVCAAAAGYRRHNEIVSFRQELQRLQIPLLGIVLTKGGSD